MRHELQVEPTAEAVAERAAAHVARRAREAVEDHGRCTFAVSGGHTPWAMFAALAQQDVPWHGLVLFQVDERVAQQGDPDRNLTHLKESLSAGDARNHPAVIAMPVDDVSDEDTEGLDKAAAEYAAMLPRHFDIVHLGLGPDGHTASLVPGDPVLDVRDRLVSVTGAYQGHRRMTLTYPALARADEVLWLVTGEDKKEPLERLLAGDESIPAGRVTADRSLVLADWAAT